MIQQNENIEKTCSVVLSLFFIFPNTILNSYSVKAWWLKTVSKLVSKMHSTCLTTPQWLCISCTIILPIAVLLSKANRYNKYWGSNKKTKQQQKKWLCISPSNSKLTKTTSLKNKQESKIQPDTHICMDIQAFIWDTWILAYKLMKT